MSHLITQKIRNQVQEAEKMVCNTFRITQDVIEDPVRSYLNTRARMAVWLILRRKFHMSFPLIGQLYGKTHATVQHGIGVMEKMGINLGTFSGEDVQNVGTDGVQFMVMSPESTIKRALSTPHRGQRKNSTKP